MSDERPAEPLAEPAQKLLGVAEVAVYALTGLLLVAGAAAVLITSGYHVITDLSDGLEPAVIAALDGLLLVFVLLELLAGVRATITEEKLVAEPFLVAGIIVAIKEIVVISLEAKDLKGEAFEDAMLEIAVLGGLALVLGLTSFLVRRKEREPTEE